MLATNNAYGIEISHLRAIDGGYQFKVTVTTIGMFIFGFTARESKREGSEWWIQPPSQWVKGRYVKPVEFSTQTEFWSALQESVTYAINEFNPEDTKDVSVKDNQNSADTPLTEEDLDEALRKFGLEDNDQPKAVSWREQGERL